MKTQASHNSFPIYKNEKQVRIVAFFSRLHPAGWFNDFENIKKEEREGSILLKKTGSHKICYHQNSNTISMKSSFKISGIMPFILLSSVTLFAQYGSQPDNKQDLKKQPDTTIAEGGTPVYFGDKNYQVAILETDFPKVAARFSKAFPAAGRQLWIKEGNALFAYFLNNGNKVSAVFTSRGSMSYAVTLLNASAVPEDIRNRIKKKYNSFSFFSAKQIQAGGYTAYELVFENSNEYIMLSTTDDDDIVIAGNIRKTTADKNFADKMP